MPVEDHEIHPATQHGSEFRYGCQTRERKSWYPAPGRAYFPDGTYVLVRDRIEDTSSSGCRFMDYEGHSGCTDCPQPKDMEYIEKMRGLK